MKGNNMSYKPLCPFGKEDCICDPAYIFYYYPDWYKKMHRDMTPEEVVMKTCAKKKKEFPNCYDDEDK